MTKKKLASDKAAVPEVSLSPEIRLAHEPVSIAAANGAAQNSEPSQEAAGRRRDDECTNSQNSEPGEASILSRELTGADCNQANDIAHCVETTEIADQCEETNEIAGQCDETNEADLSEARLQRPVIGNYKIEAKIGSGGMSVVYKARNVLIGKTVAIKFLSPDRTPSDQAMLRFRREAQAACALNHEHIVATREYNLDENGQAYLVMDFVEGESLKEKLKREGQLDPQQLLPIIHDVCDGLAHAHAQGVVHRDIKPDNIMICTLPDRKISCKIVDFGIAKILSDQPEGQNLTQTGQLFGSPLYMSPEQCRGREVDERSDIYSLGCVMYEALSGKPPFFGESVLETMMMHINMAPDSLSHTSPDAQKLSAVIMRALEKNPADRYQKIEDLQADLELLQSGKSPSFAHKSKRRARPALNLPSIIACGLGILMLSSIGAVLWAVPVLRYMLFPGMAPEWQRTEMQAEGAVQSNKQALAVSLFDKSLKQAKAAHVNHEELQGIYTRLSTIYADYHEFQKLYAVGDESTQEAERRGDFLEAFVAAHTCAYWLNYYRQYDLAAKLFEHGEQLVDRAKVDKSAEVSYLVESADCYLEVPDYASTERAVLKALPLITEENTSSEKRLEALRDLAYALHFEHRDSDAIPYYQQAIKVAGEAGISSKQLDELRKMYATAEKEAAKSHDAPRENINK